MRSKEILTQSVSEGRKQSAANDCQFSPDIRLESKRTILQCYGFCSPLLSQFYPPIPVNSAEFPSWA